MAKELTTNCGKLPEEFNLSEKIEESPSSSAMILYLPSVKEFIKICLAEGWDKQFGEPNEDINKGIQFMKETISKYAGDKFSVQD